MSYYPTSYSNVAISASTSGTYLYSTGASHALTNATVITTDLHIPEGSDVKIGNRSVIEILKKCEERLNILVPNPDLEKEFEELRELRLKYQELESKLIEQKKMWQVLKKQD